MHILTNLSQKFLIMISPKPLKKIGLRPVDRLFAPFLLKHSDTPTLLPNFTKSAADYYNHYHHRHQFIITVIAIVIVIIIIMIIIIIIIIFILIIIIFILIIITIIIIIIIIINYK